MTDAPLRIAVIGAGPRALGAVEALIRHRGADQALQVDLYDPTDAAGAGPNFAPDQTQLCLLNTPLRAIDLPPCPCPGFAALADWLPEGARDPDSFPSRAALGGYLVARMAHVAASAPQGVTLRHLPQNVDRLEAQGGAWRIGGTDYDAVLLTPGQPDTAPDDQIAAWQTHARSTGALLTQAYPPDALLAAQAGWSGKTVAIRGLGLSTLDVLRLLTRGAGGRFTGDGYLPSGDEPARIIPFSRDGLPPLPKPATAALDDRFTPTEGETTAFRRALKAALEQEGTAALTALMPALVPPVARILAAAGAPADPRHIADWLAQECEAPASQEVSDPVGLLDRGIAMARGAAPPSIGYAVGQVWRKWQNDLRRGFNPHRVPAGTAKALIGFDEGLKRISYGPPVETAEELAVLIRAGLVTLRAADDPDVTPVPDGWRLSEGDTSVTAQAMIDAVLPPPLLDRIADPMICDLARGGRITAHPATGGLRTDAAARLLDRDGRPVPGLALLGRMATGSIIAPDSIHDCFGEAAQRWARGLLTPD